MAGLKLSSVKGSKLIKPTALALSLVMALALGLGGSGVFSPGRAPAGPVAPPVVAGHAAVGTPRQLSGTAAGRSHLVPASVTAADRAVALPLRSAHVPSPPREGSRGTTQLPQPPKGTLPPQRFNVPRSSAHTAPHPPKAPPGPGGRRLRVAPPQRPVKITGYSPETSRPLPASAGHAFARVFQNADGTRTARIYQQPVNYQKPDGTWAAIDTSLVKTGSAWHNAADSVAEQFAPAGTAADLAQLGFGGGRQVGFGVAGASPVTAAVSGSTVTYPGIVPGADLVLTALPGGGAKDQIILHSAQAPASWVYPLDLHGLTPQLDSSGRVLFTDAAGNVVAWIPHAFMTDSNIGAHSDIGAYSAGVTYQLQQAPGGGWALKMTLDQAWLDDSARVFPVTVDPTALWNYADSQDTFVQTGYSTSNYTSDELRVGTYDGGSDIAATYLDFSALSSELSHDTIYGATLYLDEIWSWSCTAEPVDVYKVTQSWAASNIAGYPGPSYNSTALGSASFAAGYTSCPNPAWEHIDLGSAGTSLVQSWANGGSNYGLTVRAGSATNDYYWKKFDSDNAAYGLNTPYLAVTYSPYNADYAFTSSTPTVSPAVLNNQAGYVDVKVTNKGHDTWTPTNGYKLQYEVYQGGKPVYATPAQTPMPSSVAPGQTVTVHAKINPLPPGGYDLYFDMIYVTSSGYALFSDWGVPRTAVLALTVPEIPPNLTAMYPQNNYQAGSLTPQLFAAATSVDDWPTATINYWFSLCAGPYGNFSWCVSSPWQAGRTWQVPSGKLSWGQDYYWTVWAQNAGGDGTQKSTTGPWYLLQTAVPQPVITSHLSSGQAAGGTLDPAVGNYSSSATDASVATDGPRLAVTRTYNSLDPRTGGLFGAGWSTVYDMRVTPDGGGTGSVVVTLADGTQGRFAQNSDGSYSPPPGTFATLATVSGGGWQLMGKSSTTYAFNAAGQLTSITDNRGRAETLAYSSGQLATVTSASGRALHVTWNGGHVATVYTDPTVAGNWNTALTWTYAYSGDDLSQVCAASAPAPNCTSYSYTAGSHLQTAVLDSGPVGYWPLADSSGSTADSAIEANLGADDGSYSSGVTLGSDAGPAAGSSATAARFGGGSDRVFLPQYTLTELGPFITAGAWFKTTSDGVILDYQNSFYGATPSSWVPALYVGTDGKLRGEFWTGNAAPITSASAVNDGKWHQAVLSGNGTTQTLYLDGHLVGTLSGTISGSVEDDTFVGNGYVTNWPATPSGGGYFGFTGDIADVATYDTPLGPAAVAGQYQAAQPSSELSKITLPSGRVQAQLTYDTAADRVTTETDSGGGTWQLGGLSYGGTAGSVTATAKLTDPRGGVITSVYDPLRGYQLTSQTDQAGGTTTWGYNTGGFADSVTDPNGDPTHYYLDARGNIAGKATLRNSSTWYASWYGYYLDSSNAFDPRNDRMLGYLDGRSASALDGTYMTNWSYDSFGDLASEQLPATPDFPSGRTLTWAYTAGTEPAAGGGTTPPGLLATSTGPAGRVTSYAYDAAGDLAQRTAPNGLVTQYTYDGLGRKTSMTVISSAYPGGVTTSYTYDALGHLLTQTGPAVPDAVTGITHTAKTSYAYDGDGNQLTATISDTTGGDTARTTTNSYNGNGELATATSPAGAVTSSTYDASGNTATVTDPDGNTYAYTYTPTNQVATKTLQNWTGNPLSPSPPASLTLDSYSYDPAGRLASATDSMGRTTSYAYYKDNLLATVTATGARLNGSTTPVSVVLHSYSYDGAGNLTQDVANGGLTTTNKTWDAATRLTSQTLDPSGLDRVTTYGYDADNNVTSVIKTGAGSPGSQETDYTYDSGNHLTSKTVKDGSQNLVTTDAVDQLGQVTAVTDPRGNVSGATAASYTTTSSYDPAGNLATVTGPPVQATQNGATPSTVQPVTTYGYNTFAERAQVEDPLGHVTWSAYDADGRLTSVHRPSYTPPGGPALNPVTTTAYDANGNVTSVTDPAGNTTSTVYDQLGDKVQVIEPQVAGQSAPGQWNYAYDTDGEQTAAAGPTGAQTQATYDDLGRHITATQVERYPSAAADTTAMTYDTAGNLATSTDPLGNVTSYAVDAAGEVTKVTDPLGHATSAAYDGFGDLAQVTSPLGDTTTAAYDAAGRQTSLTQANQAQTLTATTSFGYDPAGNQTSVTNPDGNTTTSGYDALNRLTSVTRPVTSSASDVVSYGYDAAGNRTLATDGNGNSTVTTYNTLGLPESVIVPATAAHPAAADRTFTTSYDGDGRPVTEAEPGGISRSWAYDALGEVTGQTGSGAGAPTAARTLGYDLAGNLTSYSAPGGTVSISYDDRGLPLTETGAAQPAQSYAYNGDGQLTSRTDAAGTAAFGYDKAGDLSSMTDPLTGTSLSYGYDAAGELTSLSYGTGANSRALGYDGLGRVTSDTLTAPGGATLASASYSYDSAGNLTGQVTTGTAGAGTSSYSYDQAGWLTSWTAPSGAVTSYGYDNAGNLTAAGAASYSYDQRDELTSAAGPPGTTSYSYAPSGTLAQAAGPSGTTSYSFNAFGQLAAAGSVSYGYDALGRLAQRTGSAGTTSLAYDGTASLVPAAILSSGGQVSQAYSRDPSGSLVAASSGGAAAAVLTSPLHGDVTATFTPSGTSLTASAAYDPWGNITATSGTMPALGYQGGYTDPATGLVDMGSRWYDPATAGFTTADNPLTITDPTGHTVCLDDPIACIAPAAPAAQEAAGCVASGVCLVVGAAAVTIGFGLWAGMTSRGPSTLLPGCSGCSGLSSLQGINFSSLPNLSGMNFSGLPDVNFSGLGAYPNLSGLNLSGLGNFNFNFNFNFSQSGYAGPGAGGCGISCLAQHYLLPPPCDQACQQAKLILHNENVVVPPPHETPAITQAQLNARRLAIEARDKAKKATQDTTGKVKPLKGQEAPDTAEAASGTGGPPAGGGGPNRPTGSGCVPGGAAEGPLHHIATNKSNVSTARGGPWTPKFRAIFDKAGMSLNDSANLITVPGHQGPHPELYHQMVLDRLLQATDGLTGLDYAQALRDELASIGQEAQTPGSAINNLLTGGC